MLPSPFFGEFCFLMYKGKRVKLLFRLKREQIPPFWREREKKKKKKKNGGKNESREKEKKSEVKKRILIK